MKYLYNDPRMKTRRQELRNSMPRAEELLWRQLRHKSVDGLKFRRQYGVGPYVVDFYCPEFRLAIELDGDSHFEPGAREYDQERQQYIEHHGIHFLRFLNSDVYEGIEEVVEIIRNEAKRLKENFGFLFSSQKW